MHDGSPDGLGMTVAWDGQVNDLAGHVRQADQLGGSLVAERRTRSGPQHGRPQQGLAAKITSEGGVDPSVDGTPGAGAQPVLDGVGRQAVSQSLTARDDVTLSVEQFGPAVVHAASVSRPPGQAQPQTPPVEAA